jgi:carbohydrate-binding DOMON domain-containing protein
LSLPVYRFTAPANKRTVFSIDERVVTLNQKRINPSGTIPALPPVRFTDIKLATPKVKSDLASLKGPTHTMLKNSDVKQTSNQAKILIDVSDPEGDDTGSGEFIYPQTPYLQAKSFDITRFTVSADEKNVFFKLQFANLSNPGWHPEYGFQLTYVAIAIDKDGKPHSGQTVVGMNSNYVLENKDAFEQIIFVGGGIRLVDAKGKIIAEHIPLAGDEKNPLGNVLTKTIEFSLPIEHLGKASDQWRYTVLVGCQDDHGGAGIGEFRSVGSEAGEWIGGGKSNPNLPNVYDVIQPSK